MKDYTNFHTQSKDKIEHDANCMFQYTLDNSIEAVDGTINGVSTRFILQNHVSSSSKYKYMRVMCKSSDNLYIGSKVVAIVNGVNKNYLTTSHVKENDFVYEGDVELCNKSLKFYNPSSLTSEVLTLPCLALSKSTIKSDEAKYLINLNGDIAIKVALDENSLLIYEGQRFIIGRKVYVVSGINEIDCDFETNTGLLVLDMEVTEKCEQDNFTTGVAYNSKAQINNYVITIANGDTVKCNVDECVNISSLVTNNDIAVAPQPQLIYTSSNTEVCTIDNSGTVTAISEGNSTITVSIDGETTINATTNIVVEETITDDYTFEFVNPASQIKLGKTQEFDVRVLNNGDDVTNSHGENITFSLTLGDGLDNNCAWIQNSENSACVIEVTSNSNFRNKYFWLNSSFSGYGDSEIVISTKIKIASLV